MALDQYLLEHVNKKVVSVKRAEGIILLLKQWFKNTPLQDVDIPACRAYVDARVSGQLVSPAHGRGGGEVTPGTCRRELGVLQAAAGHASRWKRIGQKANPPTPMPSIELPPDGEGRVVFLTKEELARVFRTADGQLRDFVQVLYFTAARRRSVERLRLSQIDLRAGTIDLTGPDETENERRSKKRRPVVPIHPKIRPVIERRMLAVEKTGSQWLWGGPTDMYRPFSAHLEDLMLADKAFPHVMRHSRASHLLMDGVPIFHVAKLLGDTIATVEKVYGHLIPDDLGAKIVESET